MAHQSLEMLGIYSGKHFVQSTVGGPTDRAQVVRLRCVQRHSNIHEFAAGDIVDIPEHRVGVRNLIFHDMTLLTSCSAASILSLTCPIYLNAWSADWPAEFQASGNAALYASSRWSVTASQAPANRSKFTFLPQSCSENKWRRVCL